jgi:hypothetical protein
VQQAADGAAATAPIGLVILADPAGAALAARLAPTVQVMTDPVTDPDVAARVVRHTRAAGRGVAVHAGRGPIIDRGAALCELVASNDVLRTALRWQAGVAPLPTFDAEAGDP